VKAERLSLGEASSSPGGESKNLLIGGDSLKILGKHLVAQTLGGSKKSKAENEGWVVGGKKKEGRQKKSHKKYSPCFAGLTKTSPMGRWELEFGTRAFCKHKQKRAEGCVNS